MNILEYKGYSACIEFDAEDEVYVGHIAGIRGGIGFHADRVDQLRTAFHEAVDDYIETCARIGKEPQSAILAR
jgi:predicted HicB family RNase H-like nuclease